MSTLIFEPNQDEYRIPPLPALRIAEREQALRNSLPFLHGQFINKSSNIVSFAAKVQYETWDFENFDLYGAGL
jgi:hypothetical protein